MTVVSDDQLRVPSDKPNEIKSKPQEVEKYFFLTSSLIG